VIRIGIRRQLAQRVQIVKSESLEKAYQRKMDHIKALLGRQIAIETNKTNMRYYEVGTGVLKACIGPRMRYSCCLYPHGAEISRSRHSRIQGLGALISKAGREGAEAAREALHPHLRA
jgi:hypothetical protein